MIKHIAWSLLFCIFSCGATSPVPTRNYATSWCIVLMPTPILTCSYTFYTPLLARYFIDRVLDLSAYYDYFPALTLVANRKVYVELFTSGFYSLTDYDYFMAESIDQLFYMEFESIL